MNAEDGKVLAIPGLPASTYRPGERVLSFWKIDRGIFGLTTERCFFLKDEGEILRHYRVLWTGELSSICELMVTDEEGPPNVTLYFQTSGFYTRAWETVTPASPSDAVHWLKIDGQMFEMSDLRVAQEMQSRIDEARMDRRAHDG